MKSQTSQVSCSLFFPGGHNLSFRDRFWIRWIWSFSLEKTGENEYHLIFTAGIENKWHLYSQHLT